MELQRLSSGIPELDSLINGGFIDPSFILLLGPLGSGKTTFAMQYLFEGAKKGENGIIFSVLSESSNSVIQFASSYWFIDFKLIGKNVFVVDLSQKLKLFDTRQQFLKELDAKINKYRIKRIVIDPINLIQLALPDIRDYRLFLFEFAEYVKQKKLHALVTAEMYDTNYHAHEAFIADGTILLQTEVLAGKRARTMIIAKMRGTHHITEPVEYFITNDGIHIKLSRVGDDG